jgi:hypothetical protein
MEQATNRKLQTGEMAQEANAFGKAAGYADVGRVYGKLSAMEGCWVL